MKRFLGGIATAVALLSTSFQAGAVPAYPGLLRMPQPDGTVLNVRLIGDENFHYYLSEDGFLLLETQEGFRYALPDEEGTLQPSPMLAANPSARSPQANALLAGMDRDIMVDKVAGKARGVPRKSPASRGSRNVPGGVQLHSGMNAPSVIPGLFTRENPFPTMGQQKVLVILVEFSDVHFSTPDAHDYFSKQLNGRNYTEHGLTGSAYDYYHTASMGQFDPSFDVYGPIRLTGTQEFYGGNVGGRGDDARPREMVAEAATLLDGQINFADYDNNKDGYVDNIFIYYAGRGEATGGGANTIWPHSWNVGEITPTLDGVKLDSYACTNELVVRGGALAPDAIGTFCHEFGHVLGLPDLYSTSYRAENTPGSWTLMCSGSYNNDSKTPPTLSSWERAALGWLKPTVLEFTGDYKLPVSLLTTNQAYLIPTVHENEFFMLENRQPNPGTWDEFVASAGMAVWHIDYNQTVWDYNIVNDDPDHQYVDFVEAHGRGQSGHPALSCFPSGLYTSFDFDSPAALKAWDGSRTDVTLSDITEDDDNYDISFHATSAVGVAQVSVDNGLRILVNGLSIIVDGTDADADADVYNAAGMKVATAHPGQMVVLPSSGIYFVRAGAATAKVIL